MLWKAEHLVAKSSRLIQRTVDGVTYEIVIWAAATDLYDLGPHPMARKIINPEGPSQFRVTIEQQGDYRYAGKGQRLKAQRENTAASVPEDIVDSASDPTSPSGTPGWIAAPGL
jgi:hypothetical protein